MMSRARDKITEERYLTKHRINTSSYEFKLPNYNSGFCNTCINILHVPVSYKRKNRPQIKIGEKTD